MGVYCKCGRETHEDDGRLCSKCKAEIGKTMAGDDVPPYIERDIPPETSLFTSGFKPNTYSAFRRSRTVNMDSFMLRIDKQYKKFLATESENENARRHACKKMER